MNDARRALLDRLEAHYRGNGWPVERGEDGVLVAAGPGGVSWLGTALLTADIQSDGAGDRLLDLSERRMPGGGELCPLDLLAAEDCEPDLRALLDRLGLSSRPHVSVYSAAG